MKKYLSVLLLVVALPAKSAIIWSWEFVDPFVTVSPNETIFPKVRVTNSAESTGSLSYIDVPLVGGNWLNPIGAFYGQDGELLYLTFFPGSSFTTNTIQPGETQEFPSVWIIPQLALLESGAKYDNVEFFVSPEAYIEDDAFNFVSQASDNGLTIRISSVPLPGAMLFYLFALSTLPIVRKSMA